jgi:phenylalanine-4-hydroxylase
MENPATQSAPPLDPAALRRIALQHGVDIASVMPPSKSRRLQELREILEQTDAPFAIPPETARQYFAMAEAGKPFGIGSLSGQTVELGRYRNEQDYESLTLNDHLSWACLVADQRASKHKYACHEYLSGEEKFEIGGSVIPDYYLLNARIYQQTGWQLATVSEIIPADVFFHCHSRRFFPVTTFMRPLGTDYLQEPDVGHDIAGHVATFTIPEVALVMNNHGLANDFIRQEKKRKMQGVSDPAEIQRIEDEAVELLLYAGRLYWFTVEFGLVMENGQMKAFGAGILSSPGETRYSVDSADSNRVLIDPRQDRDLLRLATTDYLISEFQKTYFVMKDFDSLSSLTPERILRTVYMARRLPHHTWREIVPGDEVINVGKILTSPNEKYYRLLARQELDDCLQRCAIRNLRMYARGLELTNPAEEAFVQAMPAVPETLIRDFSAADQEGLFESVTG